MAACHRIISTLPPRVLAERLKGLRAAHPGWDRAVWFSRVLPAEDILLPAARATASYCWQKDPDLFGVFARTIPATLYAAFPPGTLLLIDEDGSGDPIPRPA